MPSMSPLHRVAGSQVPMACRFPAEGPPVTPGHKDEEVICPRSRLAHSARCGRGPEARSVALSLPGRQNSRGPVSLRAGPRPWSLGSSSPESRAWDFWATFGFALSPRGAAQVTFVAGGFPHA